jgi:hypothetical protein
VFTLLGGNPGKSHCGSTNTSGKGMRQPGFDLD